MAPPHSRYRRSVLDFSRSQAGDVTTRDSAGRDNITHHQGAELSEVVELVHAIFLDDTRREHRQALVDRRFERMEALLVGLLVGLVILLLLVILLIVVVLDRGNAGLVRAAFDLGLLGRRP